MPTATLLPTGESLIIVGSGIAIGGADAFDATVLASDDADTSYFAWDETTNLNIESYTAGALPTDATITQVELLIRLRSFDAPLVDTIGAGVYLNADRPDEPHGYLGFVDQPVPAVTGWQTLTVTYDAADIALGLAELSPSGTPADLLDAINNQHVQVSISNEGDTTPVWEITYTPIIVTYLPATVPPLRQYPRDDGLTGTSVARQASFATSRQASPRQLGYL